ncbi:hypothetical protein ACFE04_008868 [Oxalis oulophora]
MQTTNGTTMYSNRLLFTSLGLLLFSSFLLPTSGSATNNYDDDNTEFIRTSCNTSSDPKLCFSSLSMYATTINKNPSNPSPWPSLTSLTRPTTSKTSSNPTKMNITSPTLIAIALPAPYRLSNVLTWMPSAVTDERTCTDESDYLRM